MRYSAFDEIWRDSMSSDHDDQDLDALRRDPSEVDPTTYRRAEPIVVNDWATVIDDDQRELLDLLDNGVIQRDSVCELGDLIAANLVVNSGGGRTVYYKNNTGLAIQFATAGAIVYNKLKQAGTGREIPTEWLGSDLSAYYSAGFRPSP